ncbi:MAG: HTH domain-containing protein, partial [Prevotella sp.]|nr:HTH domain-containing protein [Prevotella sp.]
NAIIHADILLESGVLRIEKHEDRLVFRNPGLLMLPLKEIYEGGVSKARNPKMQNMLRMIGYGENLGSGFPMILGAWKQAAWGEPVLENRLEVDEVSLVLPIKRIEGSALRSDPKSDPKSDLKNRKSGPKKLSPQERLDMIIAHIKGNPSITREEIADMIGVGRTTILKDLRILKEQYGVHYEGPSKTGKWVIDN